MEDRCYAMAQRAIAKLSMLFNAAVRWTIMRVNPVMLVRDDLPVYKREEAVPLTAEQIIYLLNAVEGHRLAALYHVALTLGLRLGKILGLQWGDIDWQAQTITIRRQVQETAGQVAVRNATKTDASLRVLPLPPRLLARLRELWERRGETLFLFPSEDGTLLRPSNFERHWRGGLARSYTKEGWHARQECHCGCPPESRPVGEREVPPSAAHSRNPSDGAGHTHRDTGCDYGAWEKGHPRALCPCNDQGHA